MSPRSSFLAQTLYTKTPTFNFNIDNKDHTTSSWQLPKTAGVLWTLVNPVGRYLQLGVGGPTRAVDIFLSVSIGLN